MADCAARGSVLRGDHCDGGAALALVKWVAAQFAIGGRGSRSSPRRHRPTVGEGRPRQRRPAARPVGVLQLDRRRAGAEIGPRTCRCPKRTYPDGGWRPSCDFLTIGQPTISRASEPASIAPRTAASSPRFASTNASCGPLGWFRSMHGHVRGAELGQHVEQRGADTAGTAGHDHAPAFVTERIAHGVPLVGGSFPTRARAAASITV